MLGIGIDTVDIARFKAWHTKSPKALARIFCPEEIDYCLSCKAKSAERFAVRYAAKEAFYKALCSWQPELQKPFISICKSVRVAKASNGAPLLMVEREQLNISGIEPVRPAVSAVPRYTRHFLRKCRALGMSGVGCTAESVRPKRSTECAVEGFEQISPLLSLTHTATVATAIVLLTKSKLHCT